MIVAWSTLEPATPRVLGKNFTAYAIGTAGKSRVKNRSHPSWDIYSSNYKTNADMGLIWTRDLRHGWRVFCTQRHPGSLEMYGLNIGVTQMSNKVYGYNRKYMLHQLS